MAGDVAGEFNCVLEPRRETLVIRPRGELDCAATPAFDGQVAEAADALLAGFARLVLDLSELTLIDATGLRAVLRMAMTLPLRSRFAIVRGPRQVQRVFELTGTDGVLPFVSLAQAFGGRA